ncbi:hypothetical protein ACIG0C_23760 [Kitasatospora aureofaciens]|uniref:Uncharacterized protein n=1 Tax=Kitasatospora aureofaciens TaxID=1894 RepID=A0A1E7N5C8_KITAU|nr:hypothetical protein [Kitasatospora aureofaciens]ARF81100.1 hypothetical protein B6264_21280 [Kitasatospora aureofaciens]OEV35889.1 hypothetical protein HS99_0008505 [Kitasatospora aureofaciens]GGU89475.1 hypothetical protein GCM10010502_48110 [Kitasatospora aureofaciens]
MTDSPGSAVRNPATGDLVEHAAGGVERLTGRRMPVAGGLDVTFHEAVGVGAGREPGPDALRHFTETENVFIHSEE